MTSALAVSHSHTEVDWVVVAGKIVFAVIVLVITALWPPLLLWFGLYALKTMATTEDLTFAYHGTDASNDRIFGSISAIAGTVATIQTVAALYYAHTLPGLALAALLLPYVLGITATLIFFIVIWLAMKSA